MKHSTNFLYLIPFGLFFLLLVFAPVISAVGRPYNARETTGTDRNSLDMREQRKQQVQNRLTETKLKVCQTKETTIKNRTTRLGDLANKMIEKFDTITNRVKEHYISKVVPSGKTLANYDSLVSDIQTKKEAVQTVLTQAQTNVSGFSCDGDAPKEQMTQFRSDMQAVKTALKDYRTSIKNLITAVRSISGTSKESTTGSQGENQ